MATSNALSVERGARVRPDRDLTAAHASQLRGALDERLAEPVPDVFDRSALERVDACGLQRLPAFVSARRARGLSCSIDAASAVARDAVRVSGLGQQLGRKLSELPVA